MSNELGEAQKQVLNLKQELESKSNQITAYLIEIKDLGQEKSQLNEKIADRFTLIFLFQIFKNILMLHFKLFKKKTEKVKSSN